MTADVVYGVLLLAYPRAFRERFGAGMREAFAAELEAVRRRGWWAAARFWSLTIVQALWFGVAERRTQMFPAGVGASVRVDWRDAWRALMAAPGVTLIAVASLALGIGANLSLATVANSLLLKQLPVREPERLVLVGDGESWTNPIWEQIRARQNQLFDGAFAWSNEMFDLSAGGVKDPVEGAYASGGLFDVLGVRAQIGRTFTARDDQRRGGEDGPVAVISAALWRDRFNRAPDILGRRLLVERVPFTIVGVMPADFYGAEVGRAWQVIVPLGTEALIRGTDSSLDGRSSWWLNVIARLKDGQTLNAAAATLRAAQPEIRRATQPSNYPTGATYLSDPFGLTPAANGRSALRSRYTRPLGIIMAVVAAVLLIACANIANLLLARASARRRDLSVRLALGASRARLARQLLAETFLVAGLGTLAGFLVARWCSALIVSQLATPRQSPFLDLSADWRLFGLMVALTVTTALLFGLAPALGVSTIAPEDALKEQARTLAGDRGVRLRDVLVVTQLALSLAVIVGAGLFLRTFAALARTPLGFDPSHLLVVDVDLSRMPATPESRPQIFETIRDAAAATPGVTGVGASVITPVSGSGWNTRISFAGREIPASAGRAAMSWVNAVSPEWFATYGMTVLSGRGFSPTDRVGSPDVTLINEAFVHHFFHDENPVGQEIAAEYVTVPGVSRFRVIGVVSNAIYQSARAGITPTMYVSLRQRTTASPDLGFTIRSDAATGRLTHDLGESLSRAAPGAAFSFLRMNELVRVSVAQERLLALLSGSFGALALLLAALGLYGVTAYSVTRRRAEIGIRIALGANRISVTSLVMRRVAVLLLCGLALGAMAAAWSTRFVGSLLFRLEPRDTGTFVAAAIVLLTVGTLAGWLPALRAARANPVDALRNP
jgi:predicted permease